MKTSLSTISSFILICSGICGAAEGLDAAKPPEEAYTVKERGPHHRLWEWTEYETTPDGVKLPHVHQHVELATGMHYSQGGEWLESREEIEILPKGGAAALHGQHQAYFPADIYEGSIELVTPDGVHLRSRPLGLSYFDGTNSVLIAELTNSIGQLLPNSNQVVYLTAFDGIDALLRYTYTRAGFEQDVILNTQLPDPKEYGLNPATTRLQLLTEFFTPPEPAVKAVNVSEQGEVSVVDQTLDFGQMRMGRGTAFSLNSPETSAQVSKQWTVLEGRQFLVEEVAITSLEEGLKQLPQPMAQVRLKVGSQLASRNLKLPAQRLVKNNMTRPIQAAALSVSRGLVLDYTTVNASLTNYTFQGDTTYYVSGNLTLTGNNTTFEGGSVIKYTNNVTLTVSTPVTWLGSSYRPVVMVGKDDNSVGQNISGSTGNPTNRYAAIALYFDAVTANTNLSLQNLRIAQAQTAISINGKSGHVLKNVQIINALRGIQATNAEFNLRNALFCNVLTNFTGSTSTGRVEHLTSDAAYWLNKDIGANLFLTNSLLVAVANFGVFTGQNVNSNSTGTGVFTNVGAGFHYLFDGSTNRNTGTTNINVDLASDLKQLTTYPPMVCSNLWIMTSTAWAPVIQRDTDVPDLGYHYDPLDRLVSQVVVSNTTSLTLVNGFAAGIHGSYGFQPRGGSEILSTGTPKNMNRFVVYSMVQEQTNSIGAAVTSIFNNNSGTPATLQSRFSDFSVWNSACALIATPQNPPSTSLTFVDCWLRSVALSFQPVGGSLRLALTNNLFERAVMTFGSGIPVDMTVNLFNNLIFRGSLAITYAYTGGTPSYWRIYNNAFDGVTLSESGSSTNYIQNGNNGYVSMSFQLSGGSSNVTGLTSFSYARSSLGNFYQQSTNFLNAGSCKADLAGLYHYTTQTSQLKETNSIVDIGYHYVALDGYGNPRDSDSDGTPDHLEDSNGNGAVNSGESNWEDANDLGLTVRITRPAKGQAIP